MTHNDVIEFVKDEIDPEDYTEEQWAEIQCYKWEEWKDYINENFLNLDKLHSSFFNWNAYFEHLWKYDASHGGLEFYLVKCDKWNKGKVVMDEPHDKVDEWGSLYWVVTIPVS